MKRHLLPLLVAMAFAAAAQGQPVVPPHQARTLEVAVADLPSQGRLRIVPGGPYLRQPLPLPATPRDWGVDDTGPWLWDGHRLWRWWEGRWREDGAHRPLGAGHRLQGQWLTGPRGQLRLPFTPRVARAGGDRACLVDDHGRLAWVALEAEPRLLGQRRLEGPLERLAPWADGCVVLRDGEVHILAGQRLEPRTRLRVNGPIQDLAVTGERLHLADHGGGYSLYHLDERGAAHWLGSQNKLGGLTALAAAGERVLAADQRGTLHLLDVSRPDTPRPLSAVHVGETIQGLIWRRGEAWAVGTRHVQRVDFSAETPPAISALGINLGGSRRGRIVGDLMYVADWFSGLHIYDIRLPHVPRLVGNLRTPGSTKGVWVEDGYAFIADDDRGLQVADVRDPRHPRLVAELPLPGLAYTFERGSGGLLYLAAHRGGVHLIDISEPEAPRLVGSYDTPGKAWAVRLGRDHLLYVADDDHGLLVLEVRDPGEPRPVSALEDLCRAEDLLLYRGLLYVACFDAGLKVLDLADPRRPRPIAHLPTPGNARGLARVGERLYLADWESGVWVFELTDPRHPRPLGRYDTRGAAWGVLPSGEVVYALDWWGGIQAIDFSQPRRPRLVGRYQGRGRIHDLAFYPGGYALTASGSGGLQVYDVKNPLNPVWGGGAELDGQAWGVAADPERALAVVAAGDGGLALFDLQQPLAPVWLARLDLPHHARGVVLRGRDAWVWGRDGWSRIDLGDPRRPRLLHSRLGVYRQLALHGGWLWLLDGAGRLWSCEVKKMTDSCPPEPRLNEGEARHLALDDERLLLAGGGELWLHDHSGRRLATWHSDEPINALRLHEGRAFLAVGAGVIELDLFDPVRPQVVRYYPASRSLGALVVNAEALLAGGNAVLLGGERLPPIPVRRSGPGRIEIQIPAGLPMGGYDLIVTTPEGVHRIANVFEVGLPPAPKKKKFTLEDLQRILESGDFPGRAPPAAQ